MLISAALGFRKIDAFIGLANFLPFFLVFASFSELIQTPAQLRRIAWLLVIGSIPVVIIGLGQQFWGWAGHVQLLGSVVDWQIDPRGTPPGRMASIFVYANVLASYLVVTVPLSLGLWIERHGRQEQRHAKERVYRDTGDGESGDGESGDGEIREFVGQKHKTSNDSFLAPVLFLTLLGNAAALILTDSRNAWAIALLACLAFAIHQGWRWFLAIMSTATSGMLWAAFGPAPGRDWLRMIVPAFFWSRLNDQLYPNRIYAELRVTQWKFAESLIQQRPWTGWGLRNFTPIYQEQMHFLIGHPHNLVLMLACETGIPATLLFLCLVGWVVIRSVRLLRRWRIRLDRMPTDSSISNDPLLLFTYLTAFLSLALFSLFDVTLFDVRMNLIGWLLLASLGGLTYHNGSASSGNQ